ncbi:hypothetical protein C2G38_2228832 [Gigaspora rosea]|uniref:Uncharacterized protein n=1 Tax=Gigaspora rosea TaxID=44941 RepID=A0A397TXD0_9GLOM|nr:hypothetical protein C2G38_2228832 [Gigaspora rosea]
MLKMATEVPDKIEPKFKVALGPIGTCTINIKWGDMFETVKRKIENQLNIPVNRIASIQDLQPGEMFSKNFTPEEFKKAIFIINP